MQLYEVYTAVYIQNAVGFNLLKKSKCSVSKLVN